MILVTHQYNLFLCGPCNALAGDDPEYIVHCTTCGDIKLILFMLNVRHDEK